MSTIQNLGREKLGPTIAYYLSFIFLGLIAAALGPTLPSLAENTSSLLSEISILFTGRSLGYLIGSSQGGRLYDRFSGHRVMAVAVLLAGGLLVFVPLIQHLAILTILLFCVGIAEGAVDVGGNTQLVWVHRDRVGPFMNGLHLFFGIGTFISPLVVAVVLKLTGGITWTYWILPLASIPVAVFLLRQPVPSPLDPEQHAQSGRINAGLVVLIAVFFFLIVGAEIAAGGWIYTYALKMDIATEEQAALLNSAFWGAFTVGRLLAIPLAVRLPPRVLLFSDLIVALLCIGAIALWPASPAVVWIGIMGAGMAVAPLFATTMSLAERLMPITGKITGWFFIGISSGSLVMPWLIGQLFEPIGPQVMMSAIVVDIVLAMIVLFLMVGDSHSIGEQ